MRRFSKNVLAIILSDASRRLLGFLAVAYLARKIGTAGFGAVNVGLTVLSYAIMVSTAGLNSFGTREIAKGGRRFVVSDIMSLRFVNAIGAAAIVVMIAVLFIANAVSTKLIVVFSASLFAHALLLDWYFQGKEDMGVIGVGRMVSAAAYLLVLVLFVRSSNDILWVAIGTIVGDFLNVGLLIASYRRRQESLPLRFEITQWSSIMKQAFPLGYGSMLAHFSVNLPTLVLGILMTNADVGVYNAASRLVFFLLIFDRVLGTVLLPASARFHVNSPETLSATLSTALKWIIVMALPVSIGGTFLAGQIVQFVFGGQYGEAVGIFRVLIWYFFFTTIHTVYTSGIIAVGQEKTYGKVMIASAIVFFVSVILFSRLFGMVGTAAAVVCSEAATLLLIRRQLLRFINVPKPSSLLRTCFAAALMGFVLYLMPPVHVTAAVLIGGIIYGTMLFVMRAVTLEEVSTLLRRV